jgi:hypothetical protein
MVDWALGHFSQLHHKPLAVHTAINWQRFVGQRYDFQSTEQNLHFHQSIDLHEPADGLNICCTWKTKIAIDALVIRMQNSNRIFGLSMAACNPWHTSCAFWQSVICKGSTCYHFKALSVSCFWEDLMWLLTQNSFVLSLLSLISILNLGFVN